MSPQNTRLPRSDEILAILNKLECECSLTPDGEQYVCYHSIRDPEREFPLFIPKVPVMHIRFATRIFETLVNDLHIPMDEVLKAGWSSVDET